MDYIVLKLATGQEIIGQVRGHSSSNEANEYWQLGDPFEVKSQWQGGQFQMGLIPFLPYATNNEVTFRGSGVIAHASPVHDLIREYTKQISGILIP